MAISTVYRIPTDDIRISFMESLANDLRLVGHEAEVHYSSQSIEFEFDQKEHTHDELVEAYKRVRNRNLQSELDFIKQMEQNGITNLFIDGKDLNIGAIQPEVRICEDDDLKKIYRYCRSLQSVPTSNGVGRRFNALVFDVAQNKPVLMGAIGLAGSSYYQRDRDELFGWGPISIPEEKEKRDEGLRRLMQLVVCIALPPYNNLYGGKLIAQLALSNPIQSYFQERYDDPLLGLVTTVATSEDHSPIFNRIQLTQLRNASRYERPRAAEMYLHIGATSAYTTIMISQKTVEEARHVAECVLCADSKDSEKGIRSSRSKSRVVPKARGLCGISREVFVLNRKAVYFAYLHETNRRILSDYRCKEAPMVDLTVEDVTSYWKKRWCEKAANREDRLSKLRDFSSTEVLLSEDLASYTICLVK